MAKREETVTTKSGIVLSTEHIEDLIISIRGKQVMLDRDLAILYGVETRVLNQAVQRNIERFPNDFMFQLTKEEFENLKSQIVTSNNANLQSQIVTSSWGGVRKLPYVFTENGIAMLSGVLRSSSAIETNILIMRAFTAMRQFIGSHARIFQRMEIMERNQLALNAHMIDTDNKIDAIFKRLDNGESKPEKGILFDGQFFDAHSLISDLVESANTRIILFDNYVNTQVFTLLDKRKTEVTATIYTKEITPQLQLDITRHNAQYNPIDVHTFTKSHDRFLCIDDTVYLIGASLKDLGKKWFAFSKMAEKTDNLLARI